MSKIGLQSESGTIQQFEKIIAKRLKLYKLLGNGLNLGTAKRLKAVSPETFLIIRAADALGDWDIDDPSYIQRYASLAMTIAQPFLDAGCCDLLEPPNEPVADKNADKAKRLCDQMVWFAKTVQARGFTTGAYNFSVGNPDYSLIPILAPGIDACDGRLLLHEYGAPFLDTEAPDHALRHRKIFALLPPATRAILKVYITETGIDFGLHPGDAWPKEGGYRKWPQLTDDDAQWIDRLLSNDHGLGWYDNELAKDPYVEGASLFGYAMSPKWAGLGFDPQVYQSDADKLINWLSAGTPSTPPVNPPIGGLMPSDQDQAWSLLGVPRNPKAAIYAAALAIYPDAVPMSPESYYTNDKNVPSVCQCFNFGYGICPQSNFNAVTFFRYLDGAKWQPNTPAVPPTIPPGAVTRITDLPLYAKQWAIRQQLYVPAAGKDFYGLIAVSQPVIDVNARLIMMVLDKNGQAVPDAAVYHIYSGNYECFVTNGPGGNPLGMAAFILGGGSSADISGGKQYTDMFYVGTEFRNRDLGQPPAPPISDTFFYGLFDHRHLDTTFTVRLLTA